MSSIDDNLDNDFLFYKNQCKFEKKRKICEIEWQDYIDKNGVNHQKCEDKWCLECNTVYHEACDSQLKDLGFEKKDDIPIDELTSLISHIDLDKLKTIEQLDNAIYIIKKLIKLKSCLVFRNVQNNSCIRKKIKKKIFSYGADTNHAYFNNKLEALIKEASNKIKKIVKKRIAYIDGLNFRIDHIQKRSEPKSFRRSRKRNVLRKIKNFKNMKI